MPLARSLRSVQEAGLHGAWVSAQLAAFNAVTPKEEGVRRCVKGLRYSARRDLRLDIYAPEKADRALPVVVFFYGGSWNSGQRSFYSFAGAALSAMGVITVIPDYRLVPEARFPDFLHDCAEAVSWVQANIARFGGDARSIFLCGHSAGAYNAAMLALDPQLLAGAGGDRQGLRGAVGLAGPYDFFPFDVRASIRAFSHFPAPKQTQPVEFVSPDAPAMLLLHGEKDTLVRPRNSRILAERLAQAGTPAEAVIYPGADHSDILLSLSRPFRKKTPALRDIETFVLKHAYGTGTP